jgi:acyl carrier protein
MTITRDAVREGIRAKVIELATRRGGHDISNLADDEILPATGLLDSAAILELVVWYESEYNLSLREEDINIDNLGSINSMIDFLMSHRSDRDRSS